MSKVPMLEPELGTRMRAFGVVLHGALPETRWLEFLHEVALAIGMNAVAAPAVWTYPVDGKGGNGQTIVLPITESFLALDTWCDHSGAYLFVCSCRDFRSEVIETVACLYGLRASRGDVGRFRAELSLTQGHAAAGTPSHCVRKGERRTKPGVSFR